MPDCTLERQVRYNAEQMFDLAIDVEHYHDFMPFDFSAHVVERDADTLRTRQAVRIGPIPLKFESKTVFHRPEWIRVVSTSSPFKYFLIEWGFTGLENGCTIRAHVKCTTSAPMLSTLLAPWIEAFTRSLVSAFEKRAAEIYQ